MNDTAVSDEVVAGASVDEGAAGWRSAALVLGMAIVAGVAWGGVAAILGYTLAWLAPLLGLAVGVMCRDLQQGLVDGREASAAKRRTVLVGVALLLLSGRVTLVMVGGAYVSTREAAADPFLVFEAALAQAHTAGAEAPSPTAGETVATEPPPRMLREARLQEQAYERVTAMTAGEKRRLVQWYLGAYERAPDRPASPAVWFTWTDLVWWPLAFAAGRWVVREEAIG